MVAFLELYYCFSYLGQVLCDKNIFSSSKWFFLKLIILHLFLSCFINVSQIVLCQVIFFVFYLLIGHHIILSEPCPSQGPSSFSLVLLNQGQGSCTEALSTLTLFAIFWFFPFFILLTFPVAS